MSSEELEQALGDMGPVDYVVVAFPGGVPVIDGTVADMIVRAVEHGIVRVLDIAFIAKEEDGNVTALDLENLGQDNPYSVFEGASSGLLDFDDLKEAANDMEPGTAAAVIVWENRWMGPIAKAIREKGGLLIDGGRIPIQGILAALDALEAAQAN